MKKYTKPEMEINAFENTDVVTVSAAGIVEANFKFEKGYNAVEF
jgi:hypothetical protein